MRRIGIVARGAWTAAAVLGLTAPVAGQDIGLTGGLHGVSTRLTSEEPLIRGRLTGFLLGGEGGVFIGRVSLTGRYLEGTVKSSTSDAAQDIVDGEFLLGVSPAPWVMLKVGPQIRSFTFTDGTRRRWLFWQGRLRAEAQLLEQSLRGYLEAWRVLAASVSGADPFDSSEGAEGGIEFRFGGIPVWTRLAYRIDRSHLQGVSKPQTVEQVLIGVGLRRD